MKKKPADGVKISEFKAHMGRYLQDVRNGHPLTLYDRNTPVATLAPCLREGGFLQVRKATKDIRDIVLPPASKRRIDFMRALDEERRDRI